MTLSELDEKLAAEKVVTHTVTVVRNPKRDGYSSSHGDWLKDRVKEDGVLQYNKCPKCGADTKLTVIHQVRYYKCTRENDHQFTRWSGLMIGKDLLEQYQSDDSDGTRYWE